MNYLLIKFFQNLSVPGLFNFLCGRISCRGSFTPKEMLTYGKNRSREILWISSLCSDEPVLDLAVKATTGRFHSAGGAKEVNEFLIDGFKVKFGVDVWKENIFSCCQCQEWLQ